MINIKAVVIILIYLVSQNLIAQGFGTSEKLTDWHFNLGDVRLGGRQILDHTDWQKVTVPHDWSVDQYASPELASCTGYLPGGIGWYRTKIDIPAGEKGKRKYLYFEGVYNNSEVYINGNWLGKRPNGYVSFMYDITDYIKHGEDNVVAVKVDHSQDADSRWYTGSGIYRDVYLITADQVHIGLWGVYYTSEVKSGSAIVKVQTTIENHQKINVDAIVKHFILDKTGKTIGQSSSKNRLLANENGQTEQVINLKNPILWSLDNPYLYVLKTKVYVKGKLVDQSKVNVGIRTLTFDANKGFALNNESMKIKGVCLHHDAGVLGAAVPRAVWKERILQLKEIGANGIRMSHNPQSTDLYELCDQLGMLVMDEAFDEWEYPKKKWIEGWNRGAPGFQGPAEYFREWSKKDLASIVYRDRNHPSIIMWSIGNEVDYPNDPYSHPILDKEGIGQQHTSGYQTSQPHADRLGNIATELAEVVRNIDQSRPVTAALAGAVMSNETDYPGALDVVGYNYTESRYQIDHKKYPERVLYGSETRHDLNAWKAVIDNDFIFGQFIWTGFDYLGEAGAWPSRGFMTGMIDQANNIKARGYFRKALWSDEPTVYLGAYPKRSNDYLSIDAPHIWNYSSSEIVRVVAYTNSDEAELLLNGKVVGERKPSDPNTAIIYWDIPYQSGELKVVVYDKGKQVAEDKIVTTTSPKEIKARVISDPLKMKGDVVMIKIELLDENGNIADLADNMIKCKVMGNGRLMGLENASGNASEDYNADHLRCKNGKLLAYIQATDDQGDVIVSFESNYLEKIQVEISIIE